MKKRFLALSLAIVCVLSFSGCKGNSNQQSSSPDTNSQENSQESSQTSGQKVTITLLGGGGNKAYYEALAAGFNQTNPDITVNVKTEADNNYNTVVQLAIAGDNAPDIYAPVDLISDVKDNLAANLDEYATKYGWESTIPKSILDQGRVNSDLVRGSGSIYQAGGNAGSVVGVFYNRAQAKEIGMTTAPETLAEFEKYLQAAKDKGLTPIVGAAKDGAINHLESLLIADFIGQQAQMDYIYHVPNATINSPAAIEAIQVLQDWIAKGYFNSDINAVDQQTSYGYFAEGKGLFMFQGSWMTSTMDANFKGEYGFFPFAKKDASSTYTAMMGNMMAFSITEKSKNKDAAAEFLNWLTTSEASKISSDSGFLVASGDTPKVASLDASLIDQMQAGFSVVSADNGVTNWLVNATAASGKETTTQLQLLFAKKITAEEFLSAIQEKYEADLEALE